MVLRYIESKRLRQDPPAGITCVAFDPSGTYLATGSLNGEASIWSIADGRLLYVFSAAVPVLSLVWGEADGYTVMCGLNDGTIACLTITKSDLHVVGFSAHSCPVECLSMRLGILASGALEEVRIWRRQGKEWFQDAEIPSPPKTSYNRLLNVVVTSLHWMIQQGGQAHLIVTYLNHGVHIFNALNWGHVRSVPIPGQIADSSVSKDGKLIAISNVISGFDVYSLESDDALCTVGHTVTEYRKIPIVLIHEAAALVGGNLQGDVHLWDVSSGRKLHSLVHAEGDQILAIAAYYDTERDVFLIATGILRGTSDTSVVVWKAEELDNPEPLGYILRLRTSWVCTTIVLISVSFGAFSVLVMAMLSTS